MTGEDHLNEEQAKGITWRKIIAERYIIPNYARKDTRNNRIPNSIIAIIANYCALV